MAHLGGVAKRGRSLSFARRALSSGTGPQKTCSSHQQRTAKQMKPNVPTLRFEEQEVDQKVHP